MARSSKLQGEEGVRSGKGAGSAEAAGCFLLLSLPPRLSLRERLGGGGQGRGKVVTRVNQPPSGGRALRGSRRGLAPLPRACAARM